jgi:hypothetical protein
MPPVSVSASSGPYSRNGSATDLLLDQWPLIVSGLFFGLPLSPALKERR